MAKPERSGILLLDKPQGPTCRRLLDDLEKRLKIGALGHAGTLDPLATGLVVVLVGRMRKLQDTWTGKDKTYRARIRFGGRSDTMDAEGPIHPSEVAPPENLEEALAAALPRFLGTIDQVPPKFSAIHVGGKRAHRLARAGQDVEMPTRRVRIDAIEILAVDSAEAEAHLEVRCGAGTYIRSLAHDLGEALGCGAWLADLRRTASGALVVTDATAPEDLTSDCLRTLEEVLGPEPRVACDEEETLKLVQGQTIQLGTRPWLETEETRVYAWHQERIVCRLKLVGPGVVRSDLKLGEAPEPPRRATD